jgi:hypothetical protein
MDYRQIYEARQNAPGAGSVPADLSNVYGVGVAPDESTRRLLTDMQRAPSAPSEFGETVPALIATLLNDAELVIVRLAALRTLGAMAFLGAKFAPYRADFLTALRKLTTLNVEADLREEALAILATEKDADTQESLRRGLQNPELAQVPAAIALQLLGLDDHASVAELARQVFHATTDVAAKEAALRLLATDPNSQELFSKILQDKSQPRNLRALSATALNILDPEKFSRVAQHIAEDKSDFEDIRASVIGALANAPETAQVGATFLKTMRDLGSQTVLKNLKTAAERYLTRS